MPQCSDGIDNDGDGLIDYAGGNLLGTPVAADPQCRSATWNSESTTSDMGAGVIDAGNTDAGGTIPPGETDYDGYVPFEAADGGVRSGGGSTTVGNVTTNPPRQGCDMGGQGAPALPIVIVLALGGGLTLLARRKST